MKSIQSKTTRSGNIINIMDAGYGRREHFALGKRYWIAYGNGSPRRAINCSDSLKYITTKFNNM
jgi:uncharacterized membrane protein YukC|tara:strand:+ start:1727 stop:1918 length:192 start_codon:yes stop_codon:yes gene_type:complete